jgi:phage major head subunit gpT-like protein
VRVRGLSRDEIATRALHTTSDFPAILAAVTNKTLRDAYEAAPRTFPPIARRATAADFKDMHRLQLGEAPQLEKVNESGEFKRGSLGEGKESYRVETWGKVIGITRQVIINDDLDAFTRIPALFGTAAATLESDVVWGIVTANPNMADGVTLFHANHKNLVGTGTALDVANLGKARAQMAKQTGLDGKTVLNIRPAFLVVPSSLELTAEQLIAQNLVPAKSADVVPQSIRSLAVIAEPRLDPASGAVPWYLFASPSSIDTIEYAYLEGQDGVYIETRMGFDVDGVEIKARLDFGAKAIDWRGLFKNAGVAP